ncbi:ABC transporter ATP-binding protein [Lactobacillus nasalidis]|nr:ABC transporter ATP-binding protein [Lactobacillus nasalidis]
MFLVLVGTSLALLLADLTMLARAKRRLAAKNGKGASPYANYSKLTLFSLLAQLLINVLYLWNYWAAAFKVGFLAVFFLFAGNLLLEFIIFCDDFFTDISFKNLRGYRKSLSQSKRLLLLALFFLTFTAAAINFFPAP